MKLMMLMILMMIMMIMMMMVIVVVMMRKDDVDDDDSGVPSLDNSIYPNDYSHRQPKHMQNDLLDIITTLPLPPPPLLLLLLLLCLGKRILPTRDEPRGVESTTTTAKI